MRAFCVGAVIVLACSGCLHLPLRNNFLDQSTTISQLEHQQVIDNLAKFVVNPASLPHFAVPDSGTTQMSAQANGGLMFNYTRAMFNGWNFNVGGNTIEQENWVLKPVNDPARLRRMRCAYQLATGAHPGIDADGDCTACLEQLRAVKLIAKLPEKSDAFDDDYGADLDAPECQDRDTLHSLNCNFPREWYGVGCKREVPKCACYVGHYCGTYVWITPDQLDAFTRFTLSILTLATTDPPGPNAEVERSLDAAKKVIGYKIKTKEDVSFPRIGSQGAQGGPNKGGTDAPSETAKLSGPQSEPRVDGRSPTSALQGLIQLDSR